MIFLPCRELFPAGYPGHIQRRSIQWQIVALPFYYVQTDITFTPMPAHISHSILAEDLLVNHLSLFSVRDLYEDQERSASLLLGAQGPDIFYHNQRTMPSGLLIGSLLHRRGYGSVSAAMLEYLLLEESSWDSPEAIYLYGFISHGIMDRIMHPFINYFSGWVNDDDTTRSYRDCHPFFERIIDSALAVAVPLQPGSEEQMWRIRGNIPRHHRGSSFSRIFDRGDSMHTGIHRMLQHGLGTAFSRLRTDEKLERRLENAYMDSRGFYRFCESVQESPPEPYKQGWENPQASRRWKALSHPDRLPDGPDYANLERSTWYDPCNGEQPRNEGIGELYTQSVREARRVLGPIVNILKGDDPPPDYPGVPGSVGDHGLRSPLSSETPCTMFHMDPLPLYTMLDPGQDLPGSSRDVTELFAPLGKRIT